MAWAPQFFLRTRLNPEVAIPGGPLYGCSLASLRGLASGFGYEVVGSGGAFDLLLVRKDLLRVAEEYASGSPLRTGWGFLV